MRCSLNNHVHTHNESVIGSFVRERDIAAGALTWDSYGQMMTSWRAHRKERLAADRRAAQRMADLRAHGAAREAIRPTCLAHVLGAVEDERLSQATQHNAGIIQDNEDFAVPRPLSPLTRRDHGELVAW